MFQVVTDKLYYLLLQVIYESDMHSFLPSWVLFIYFFQF